MDDTTKQAFANALFATIKATVESHKALDMDTEKIVTRVGYVALNLPHSRTNVLATMIYAAMGAPVVGITKEQLTTVVSEIFDAAQKLPGMSQAADTYKTDNAEFLAKTATTTSIGGVTGILSLGGNKVH